VSAIAYYLEDEGIATTGISLVRENTASFQSPRFLWVSFPLGRPLGAPGDSAFQHRVIAHALDLLRRPSGPVLEDFDEDMPADTAEAFVCPVSFAPANDHDADSWVARLRAEIADLAPWYDAAVNTHGKTTVGILQHAPAELGERLGEILDQASPPPGDIKLLLEDLKAYYLEAVAAQPGAGMENRTHWLWQETELGAAVVLLYQRMRVSSDSRVQERAESLLPRSVSSGLPG
jgi:D-proline reductase (dithiol) PrdB